MRRVRIGATATGRGPGVGGDEMTDQPHGWTAFYVNGSIDRLMMGDATKSIAAAEGTGSRRITGFRNILPVQLDFGLSITDTTPLSHFGVFISLREPSGRTSTYSCKICEYSFKIHKLECPL